MVLPMVKERPQTVACGCGRASGASQRSCLLRPVDAQLEDGEEREVRLEQERQRWMAELLECKAKPKSQSAPAKLSPLIMQPSKSESSLIGPSRPATDLQTAYSSVVGPPPGAAAMSSPFIEPSTRRRRQRPSRDHFGIKGARMLKGAGTIASSTEARFSTRLESHTHAADQFLKGLHLYPDDDRLSSGFEVALQTVRMYDEHRFAAWPFNNPVAIPLKRGAPSAAPEKMRAPRGTSVTHDSVGLKWEVNAMGVGYEVEVAVIDALDGQKEWQRVYRGPNTTCFASKLSRGALGYRARVRAYNGAGDSEWSPRSEMLRLTEAPSPVRVEVDDIPGEWLTIDLAGIPDLNARNVTPELLVVVNEGIVKGLHANRTVIKVAFRYYALAGVSNVEDDPSTMTMTQFGNFVRGCKLLSSNHGNLSSSDVDRIFLRAIRPPMGDAAAAAAADAPSLTKAASAVGIKSTRLWKKAKMAIGMVGALREATAKKEMNQSQFVAALIRLVDSFYSGHASLSLYEKLAKLIKEQVENHVLNELRLIEDEFDKRIRTRAMGSVLDKHNSALKQVFTAYAQSDKESSKEALKALDTMNVLECNELCDDIGIFDKSFTVRELLCAFVKVNLDDDLYKKEESGQAANSSELDFDEFEEWLARVFHVAIWGRSQQVAQTASLLDQDGDGDLDADDADDLFLECDADGSGSITPDELLDVLKRRLNESAAVLVSNQLVTLADTDGSGEITREELREAILTMSSGRNSEKEQADALERGFSAWLGNEFVPKALAAVGRKKNLQVKPRPSKEKD